MKFLRTALALVLAGFAVSRVRADSPIIFQISPNYGVSGQHVAIIGQNFLTAGPVRVFFGGGLQSASVVNTLDTVVEVIIPPKATIGPVIVSNNDGQDQTFSDFIAGPYVSGFARLNPPPSSDDDKLRGNPGDEVLIDGLNFESNDGSSISTSVYFGNLPATGETRGSQEISVFVPANAVTGPITVTTIAGGYSTSPQYFYITPNIVTFTDRAVVGGKINLAGTSFLGVTNVTIGGIPAPVFSIQGATGTNIVVTVPPGAPLSGAISVTSGGNIFTTTANFLLLPSVTSFSANGGAPGTSITINGYGLANTTNVFFGGVASVPTSTTANSVTVTVPTGAQTGPVRVNTLNGTYLTTNLFYLTPVVSSFTPAQGIAGAQVTLSGLNFTGATAVAFSNATTLTFNVASPTSMVVTIPSGAMTGLISVTGPGGTGSSAVNFTVLGPQPYVYSFTPAYGQPGTTVTLGGLNFSSATAVTFNGVGATTFSIKSDTQLTAVVPLAASSGPITVFNPQGTGTSSTSFIVATNADLSLQMSANPSAPVTDSDILVNFTIRNQGPLPAAAVTGNFTAASVTTVTDTSSTVGTSDIIGKTAVFTVGDLAPGNSVSGTIKVHVITNASFSLSMTTSSTTPDSNTLNNSFTLSLQSTPITLQISATSDTAAHLSWPIVSSSYFLEQTGLLYPAAWTRVTNTPDSDGSEYFLNLSITNPGSYFRLRKP